jgi:hypothetical protein
MRLRLAVPQMRSFNWQRVRGQPSHVKQAKCPWCRLAIQLDDKRRVSSHEAPVCDQWRDLMAEARARFGERAAIPIGAESLPMNDDDN